MKKLFAFVLGLLLFFCPLSVEAEEVEIVPQEEIADVPALDPITEAEINGLLGKYPSIEETYSHFNKVSTIRDYSKKNR